MRWRTSLINVAITAAATGCATFGVGDRGGGGGDDVASIDTLEVDCADGDGASCTALGLRYELGEGVGQGRERALGLYIAGCEHGDAHGCVRFAARVEDNAGSAFYARAAQLWRAECNDGDAAACYRLGVLYSWGEGVGADVGRALSLYQRACDGGLETACERVGDVARRWAARCDDRVAAARATVIEDDAGVYVVKSAIAAWKEARAACGEMWSDAHQADYVAMRAAADRNVARRAWNQCSVAVDGLYDAVDGADLAAAELALLTVRGACAGTEQTRAQIIAVEKLMTQHRHLEAHTAAALESVMAALYERDLPRARTELDAEPRLVEVLRADEGIRPLLRGAVTGVARDLRGGIAPRVNATRLCAARAVFVRVLGDADWDVMTELLVTEFGDAIKRDLANCR